MAIACCVAVAACGDAPEEPQGLARDVFVGAYVDLRVAALRSPDGTLPPEERDRILRDHAVSEEELVDFVERHGTDPEYMREVWDEVEQRLEAIRSGSDSASVRSSFRRRSPRLDGTRWISGDPQETRRAA